MAKPGVIEEPILEKGAIKVIFVEKIEPPKKKFSEDEIKKAKALLTAVKRENFWRRLYREVFEEAKVEVRK